MKKMKIMKKICLVLLFLIGGMQVASADLYTVSNIPIAAELNSAKEARSAAIQNGQTDAFWALMKKMVDPENLQLVPGPTEEEIVDWVQHVSLANEKNTATKYMATLTVRFHENKIRDFLTAHQIPFLTQELPSAVVVPVWQREGNILSLEDRNLIYTYLRDQYASDTDDKIVIPAGGLEEILWVKEAFDNKNSSVFKNFSDKYETETVLVLTLDEEENNIKIGIHYVPAEPALETERELQISAARFPDVFPNMWNQIVTERRERWKRLKTQNFELAMTFWVQVPITQLSDWRTIRQKLEKAKALENLVVRGFRPGEIWITWQYKGTSVELNRQLKPLGLYLDVSDVGGAWVLTRVNKGNGS